MYRRSGTYDTFLWDGWRDNRQEKAENPSHLGGQISARITLKGTSKLARVLVAKNQPMRLFLVSQNHSKSYLR